MKKVLALLVCVAMTLGMLSGCGQKSTSEPADSAAAQEESAPEESASKESAPEEGVSDESINFDEDPYEVRMVISLPATTPNEGEVARIMEKINEITLKELNMTLKLEILPSSVFQEQIQLELSSGSDIDIFTSDSSYGPNWVSAGYVEDLKPLLEEYGQDILNSYATPELAMVPNVGGFVYGVPVHKEISEQTSVYFRTDILDKYGIDVSNVETIEDVDAIYEQVAEQEPGMWMVSVDKKGWAKLEDIERIGGAELYGILDPTENTTVEILFGTDAFRKWCDYAHKWFEKGWINSGAASDSESYYSYIASGQAFSFFNSYGHPLSESDQEANCNGVDLTMVSLTKPLSTSTSVSATCYSISSGSKDPAKAMKMLNLIESRTELMNLLNWGVEGEDYIVNEEGLLDFPEGKDESSVGYHLGAGWILPNQFVCTPWVTDGADIYSKVIAYNEESQISKSMGFNFDPAPIQDQLAAVQNVRAKYYSALVTGAVDPEEYIPIMLEEMNNAGSEEIIAEIQRQLDDFLSSK